MATDGNPQSRQASRKLTPHISRALWDRCPKGPSRFLEISLLS